MRPKSQAARIPPIEVKISDQHQRLRTLSAAERKQVQKAVDDTVSDLSRILAKEPPWDNRKKITVEIWRDYAPPGTAHYDDSARTVRIQWQHHNKVAETDFKGILAHEITHAYENDLMYSSGKKVPFAKKFYEARWAEEGVDSARTWQQQIVRQRKMFPDSYQHQIYYDDNTELVTMGVEHFFGGYRSDLQKIRKGKWPKGWPDDIGIPPPASDDKYWAWINQTIMNRTDEEMFKHLKRQRANGTLKLAKNSDLNKRIDAWKPPAKPKLTKVTPIDTKLPGTTARRAAVKKAVAETPEFSTTLRTKIVSRLQKIKDSKFIKVLDKHLEVTRRLKLKAKVIAFNVIKNYVRDWVIEDIPVAILHGLKHRRSLRKELAGLLTRIDKLVDSEDVRLAQRRLHDISREYEQLQKVDVEALTAGGLKSYRKKVNRIKANVKKAVEPIDLEEFDSLVWRARSIERVLQSNFFTPESLAIAKRFRDMYFRKVGDKAAIPDITVDYYNGAAKWTKAQTKIVDEAIEEVMAEFQEILPLNYDWVDVDNIKINVRAEFEMLDAKNYTAPDGTINVSWRVRATPIETERFKAIIAHELGHAYEDFLRKKHGVRIGQEYKKSRVMTELGKDDLTDLNAATIQNVLGTLIPDSTLRHVYPSGSSEVTSTGVDWMWGMFRSSLDQKWPTRYVPENWNRKHRLPQILTDPESFGYVSDIILARDLKKLAVDLLERWRKRQIGKNMASNSDLITRLIAVVPPAFRTLKRQPIKKVLKKTKETVEDITAPKPPVRPKKDFTPQQKIEVVEDIVKKKVPEAEDSTKWLTNWASKEADDVVKAAHNTRKVLDDELKEAKRIVKKADESALAKEYVRLEKAEIHLKQLHQLIKTSEELDADDLKQLRRSFNNIKKNANKAARKLPVKYDEYVAKKERIAVLEKYLKDPEFNPETVELAKRFKEVYKRPKAQAAVIPENWKIEVVDDATSIAGARKWTNKEYKKVEAAIEEVKDDISRIISQDLGWAEEAGYTIKIRTGKKDALVGNDFDPNTKTIDLYWTIDGGEESVNHFKMVLAHEIGHAYENYLQDISGKNFGVEFMRDLAEKRLPQFHPLRTLSPDPKTWSNVDVEHALKPLLPDTYMGKIYRDRTTELVSMGFEMMFGSFRSNNMKTSIRAKVPKGWNKEHHVPVLLADEDYWAWFNQSVLQRTDDKLFPQIKKHFDSPRTKEVLPPTSRLKKQLDDKVPEPEPPARPPKKFDDDDSYMPQQETSAYDWKKGHADPPAYEKYVDDLLHNDIPKPTATSSALQEWVKKEIPDVMKTAAVHRAILTKRAEYLANEFLVALEPKMDIYKSIRWKGDELWRLERQIETESSMPDADELVAGLKRRRQRLKDKINELEEQLDHSYDKLTAVQHEFEFLVRYLRKDRFGSEEFITPESIELSRRFRARYMRPKDQAAGMPRYDIQILHEPYFRSSTYERLHMWTRKDRAKLDALVEEVMDEYSRIIPQDSGWIDKRKLHISVKLTDYPEPLVGEYQPLFNTIKINYHPDMADIQADWVKAVLAHEMSHAYDFYLKTGKYYKATGKQGAIGQAFFKALFRKKGIDYTNFSDLKWRDARWKYSYDEYFSVQVDERASEVVTMGFEWLWGMYRSNKVSDAVKAKVAKGWDQRQGIPPILADDDVWNWIHHSLLKVDDAAVAARFDLDVPKRKRPKKQFREPEPDVPKREPQKLAVKRPDERPEELYYTGYLDSRIDIEDRVKNLRLEGDHELNALANATYGSQRLKLGKIDKIDSPVISRGTGIAQFAEPFRKGYFTGKGVYGHGTYFASDIESITYAGLRGHLFSAKIRPGARIATASDVQNIRKAFRDVYYKKYGILMPDLKWLPRRLMELGYDAYEDTSKKGYLIVLNNRILVADEEMYNYYKNLPEGTFQRAQYERFQEHLSKQGEKYELFEGDVEYFRKFVKANRWKRPDVEPLKVHELSQAGQAGWALKQKDIYDDVVKRLEFAIIEAEYPVEDLQRQIKRRKRWIEELNPESAGYKADLKYHKESLQLDEEKLERYQKELRRLRKHQKDFEETPPALKVFQELKDEGLTDAEAREVARIAGLETPPPPQRVRKFFEEPDEIPDDQVQGELLHGWNSFKNIDDTEFDFDNDNNPYISFEDLKEHIKRFYLKKPDFTSGNIEQSLTDWLKEQVPDVMNVVKAQRRRMQKKVDKWNEKLNDAVSDYKEKQVKLAEIEKELEHQMALMQHWLGEDPIDWDLVRHTGQNIGDLTHKKTLIETELNNALPNSVAFRGRLYAFEDLLEDNQITLEGAELSRRLRAMLMRPKNEAVVMPDYEIEFSYQFDASDLVSPDDYAKIELAVQEVWGDMSRIIPLQGAWAQKSVIEINVKITEDYRPWRKRWAAYNDTDKKITLDFRRGSTPEEILHFKQTLAHEMGHAYEHYLDTFHRMTSAGTRFLSDLIDQKTGKKHYYNPDVIGKRAIRFLPDEYMGRNYYSKFNPDQRASEVVSMLFESLWGMYRSDKIRTRAGNIKVKYRVPEWNIKHDLPPIFTNPELWTWASRYLFRVDEEVLKKIKKPPALPPAPKRPKKQFAEKPPDNKEIQKSAEEMMDADLFAEPSFTSNRLRDWAESILPETLDTARKTRQKLQKELDDLRKELKSGYTSTRWIPVKNYDFTWRPGLKRQKLQNATFHDNLRADIRFARGLEKRFDEAAAGIQRRLQTEERFRDAHWKERLDYWRSAKADIEKAMDALTKGVNYAEWIEKRQRVKFLEWYLGNPHWSPETMELSKKFREIFLRPKGLHAAYPGWTVHYPSVFLDAFKRPFQPEREKIVALIRESLDEFARLIPHEFGWQPGKKIKIYVRHAKNNSDIIEARADPELYDITIYWPRRTTDNELAVLKSVVIHELGHLYETYIARAAKRTSTYGDGLGENFIIRWMETFEGQKFKKDFWLRYDGDGQNFFMWKERLPNYYMLNLHSHVVANTPVSSEIVSSGIEWLWGFYRADRWSKSAPKAWTRHFKDQKQKIDLPTIFTSPPFMNWFNHTLLRRTDADWDELLKDKIDKPPKRPKKHFEEPDPDQIRKNGPEIEIYYASHKKYDELVAQRRKDRDTHGDYKLNARANAVYGKQGYVLVDDPTYFNTPTPQIFRGINDWRYAEKYREGKISGRGMFGNGLHYSSDREALGYATIRQDSIGHLHAAKFKPGARLMPEADYDRIYQETVEEVEALESIGKLNVDFENLMSEKMIKEGWDAYMDPNKHGYAIVLNQRALIVRRRMYDKTLHYPDDPQSVLYAQVKMFNEMIPDKGVYDKSRSIAFIEWWEENAWQRPKTLVRKVTEWGQDAQAGWAKSRIVEHKSVISGLKKTIRDRQERIERYTRERRNENLEYFNRKNLEQWIEELKTKNIETRAALRKFESTHPSQRVLDDLVEQGFKENEAAAVLRRAKIELPEPPPPPPKPPKRTKPGQRPKKKFKPKPKPPVSKKRPVKRPRPKKHFREEDIPKQKKVTHVTFDDSAFKTTDEYGIPTIPEADDQTRKLIKKAQFAFLRPEFAFRVDKAREKLENTLIELNKKLAVLTEQDHQLYEDYDQIFRIIKLYDARVKAGEVGLDEFNEKIAEYTKKLSEIKEQLRRGPAYINTLKGQQAFVKLLLWGRLPQHKLVKKAAPESLFFTPESVHLSNIFRSMLMRPTTQRAAMPKWKLEISVDDREIAFKFPPEQRRQLKEAVEEVMDEFSRLIPQQTAWQTDKTLVFKIKGSPNIDDIIEFVVEDDYEIAGNWYVGNLAPFNAEKKAFFKAHLAHEIGHAYETYIKERTGITPGYEFLRILIMKKSGKDILDLDEIEVLREVKKVLPDSYLGVLYEHPDGSYITEVVSMSFEWLYGLYRSDVIDWGDYKKLTNLPRGYSRRLQLPPIFSNEDYFAWMTKALFRTGEGVTPAGALKPVVRTVTNEEYYEQLIAYAKTISLRQHPGDPVLVELVEKIRGSQKPFLVDRLEWNGYDTPIFLRGQKVDKERLDMYLIGKYKGREDGAGGFGNGDYWSLDIGGAAMYASPQGGRENFFSLITAARFKPGSRILVVPGEGNTALRLSLYQSLFRRKMALDTRYDDPFAQKEFDTWNLGDMSRYKSPFDLSHELAFRNVDAVYWMPGREVITINNQQLLFYEGAFDDLLIPFEEFGDRFEYIQNYLLDLLGTQAREWHDRPRHLFDNIHTRVVGHIRSRDGRKYEIIEIL